MTYNLHVGGWRCNGRRRRRNTVIRACLGEGLPFEHRVAASIKELGVMLVITLESEVAGVVVLVRFQPWLSVGAGHGKGGSSGTGHNRGGRGSRSTDKGNNKGRCEHVCRFI